jgi:formylglycine-generating enzyme required for sulfatase activity
MRHSLPLPVLLALLLVVVLALPPLWSGQAGSTPGLLKTPCSGAEAWGAQQAWAQHLGRKAEEILDLGDGVTMQIMLIPPGRFVMGSPPEEPERDPDEVPHDVTLTRPYYLAKYPVTQEQYQRLAGHNPSYFSATGGGKDQVQGLDTSRLPVEQVSWDEAVAYCRKLAQQTGWKAALPTEAQWEYACRAGSATPFCFDTQLNGTLANCNGTQPYPAGTAVKGPYLERPCPVGSYESSAFGLFDMHGNVWQWCHDWYGKYDVAKRTDPEGPQTGFARVWRGGSWLDGAWSCRAANRDRRAPGNRSANVGFRVAFPVSSGNAG